MSDFQDRVVFITGAGSSPGAALAKRFAAEGAIIAANDLTPVNAEPVVAEINQDGGKAKAYLGDIATKISLQTVLTAVLEEHERVDVLVNCPNVRPRAGLLELDEWDWRRALDVNLTGVFLAMQSVGRVMRELGGGVMLNVVSEPNQGEGNPSLAYQAAQAGVVGLTQAAAGELAHHKVRVNCLRLDGEISDAFLDQALDLCRPTSEQTGQVVEVAG